MAKRPVPEHSKILKPGEEPEHFEGDAGVSQLQYPPGVTQAGDEYVDDHGIKRTRLKGGRSS